MNLNRTEWSKAQDLLVQLVQILVPLAEEEAKTVSSCPKRFFVPPNSSENPLVFRYPVRTLKTTLHSAQEQVAEWIEQLPSKRKTQNAECKTEERKKEGLTRLPLSSQVNKLIDQVRDAIGSLCTSSNIVNPKAAPLREALLRIKPLIDEVVQAVSEKRKTENAERKTEEKVAPSFPAVSESKPEASRIDRLELPGGPFLPEIRPLIPARKKPKKKESRFQRQTRDTEEE